MAFHLSLSLVIDTEESFDGIMAAPTTEAKRMDSDSSSSSTPERVKRLSGSLVIGSPTFDPSPSPVEKREMPDILIPEADSEKSQKAFGVFRQVHEATKLSEEGAVAALQARDKRDKLHASSLPHPKSYRNRKKKINRHRQKAKALEKKYGPTATNGEGGKKGVNASYMMRGLDGEKQIIFKPSPGSFAGGAGDRFRASRLGIPEPEGLAQREVIAYMLGTDVPPTCMMTLCSHAFAKFASLQEVDGTVLAPVRGSAQVLVPGRSLKEVPKEELAEAIHAMPADKLQRLFRDDLYMINGDRHKGNLLLSPDNKQLIPIDHGCILAVGYRDSAEFCWMDWDVPAARNPLPPEILSEMDAQRDKIRVLGLFPDFPDAALAMLDTHEFLLRQGSTRGLGPMHLACFLNQNHEDFDVSVMKMLTEKSDSPEELKENIIRALDFLASKREANPEAFAQMSASQVKSELLDFCRKL